MKIKLPKGNFWEKVAHTRISRVSEYQQADELFLLTDKEADKLDRIRRNTYLQAALAGALGIIFLYLPYHLFGPALFPLSTVTVPWINQEVSLSFPFLAYSVVLVVFELWFLTWLNIRAVAAIASTCGHPNPDDTYYEHNLNALVAVGVDKQVKEQISIGLDPYHGLSRVWMLLYFVAVKLKATASNFVFSFLVKRLLGRFALRQFVDFAGIPIYAFWNMWGARRVMDETVVRVMSPPLIRRCTNLLYEQQEHNKEFRGVIYDTLQLISESKRSFHYNHFLLSLMMLKQFGVKVRSEPALKKKEDFIASLAHCSAQTRQGVRTLFLFGVMIDGRISRRERKVLSTLGEAGLLSCSVDQVVQWTDDYFKGRGIDSLFEFHTSNTTGVD